jgi:N-acetylglucosamine-6-sulfatase
MRISRRKKRRLALAASLSAVVVAVAVSATGAPAGAAPAEKPDPTAKQQRKAKREKLRRANAKQKRPNVIVVETDDQSNDMSPLPIVLDKLGRFGTTFRNSYASFPLCCPSRATFLTGQYAHNHHVIQTDLPNGYNGLDHTNTLAVWLQRSGYRTAMVGKYLNGYGLNDGIPEPVADTKEIPPGWSEWYALTSGSDQRRYQYKLNENGRLQFYGGGVRNYVTDVLSAKVVDFLRRRAPLPKPFFLWFNPTAPHGESGVPFNSTRDPQPAPRYLGAFGDGGAPRSPNFDEANVSDKPEFVQDQPRLSDAAIADIDRRWRGGRESLLSVNDTVKRIIGRLKKARDLRKTYIFFTSDNGLQLGAHRLVFKSYLYEESTRVPLIVRGPRFPPGVVRDQLVANIDLAPTIVEITRARPGLTMDGISLLPLAANAAAASGRDILLESYDIDSFGIRDGDWQFNEYSYGENPEELYNLQADPFQLSNLLHPNPDPPSLASTKAALEARLAQLKTCAGASCQ